MKVDTAPEFLGRLPALHAFLRANDFEGGPDRWLALQDLLVKLAREGRLPEDEDAYRLLLAPLFCRSGEEQSRFYALFDQWRNHEDPGIIQAAVTAPVASQASFKAYRRRTTRWPWVVAALCLLLAVAGGFLADHLFRLHAVGTSGTAIVKTAASTGTNGTTSIPTEKLPIRPIPPRLPPEPVEISPAYRAGIETSGWVLTMLPVVLALAWLGWRLRRLRVVLNRQRADPEDPLAHLVLRGGSTQPFAGESMFPALMRLRRTRRLPTRHLHAAATVESTLRRGGLFAPVYRFRPQTPEFLFLIDRQDTADHSAALAGALADRLGDEGLIVHRYQFQGDPRHCIRNTPTGPIRHSLDALADIHGDCYLLITGDAEGLFHPLTGEPELWLEKFQRWPRRAWLTTRPHPWAFREAELADVGFAVAPLTGGGLDALSRWLEKGFDEGAAPWFEPQGVDPYPHSLRIDPNAWLSPVAREESETEALLAALGRYLGKAGLLCFRAMAAYPELHWGLTLAVDLGLFPDDRVAMREQRLLRLARLPWCRHGRIPDYLREKLLRGLSPKQRSGVRSVYQRLFERATVGGSGAIRLPFAPNRRKRRFFRDWLRFSRPGTPLDDRIFANVMLGGRLGLLDFELPNALAALLPGKRWQLIPVVAATLFAAAGFWGMQTAFTQWIGPWAGRLAETRLLQDHGRYTVEVYHTDTARPLAGSLRTALTTWGFNVETPQPWPLKGAGPEENTVQYAVPDAREAAQAVAARLYYLSYRQGAAAKKGHPDLPELRDDRIRVWLKDAPKAGAVFRDPLRFAYTPPVKKQPDDATAPLEPEMVPLSRGTFMMGSPETEKRRSKAEGPRHKVTIEPFAMGKHEVTFDEYDRFAKATGRKLPSDSGWGRERRPVIYVSWKDAAAYAQWLSGRTGKRYRLPTEAEWEYAARAGTATPYWWGETIGKNRANCAACGSQWDGKMTAPVGSFEPNPWGLNDTAGNVWEWVDDCWHGTYEQTPAEGSAWLEAEGGDCGRRVLRGGSWFDIPEYVRSAYRDGFAPGDAFDRVGFRLAMDM